MGYMERAAPAGTGNGPQIADLPGGSIGEEDNGEPFDVQGFSYTASALLDMQRRIIGKLRRDLAEERKISATRERERNAARRQCGVYREWVRYERNLQGRPVRDTARIESEILSRLFPREAECTG